MSEPIIIDKKELILLECVREVPDKRKVFSAIWQEQPVFIKIFLHPASAKRHWLRELNGITNFEKGNILTPKLLWSGPITTQFTKHEAYAVITQKVELATSLADAWENNSTAKNKLSELILNTLANHHKAGLRQTDLHFGNFLIANNQCFSLDGDGLVANPTPLSLTQAAEQLALLIAQVPVREENLFLNNLADYAKSLFFNLNDLTQNITRLLPAIRQKRCQKLLKKIYRNCTAIKHLKTKNKQIYLNKTYDSEKLRELLQNPDKFFPSDKSQWLKNGNSASVVIAEINGEKFVIKRYNYQKNFKTFLRRFKESRASISWRNAFRLGNYGLLTPEPVALIENYNGFMMSNAYYISKWIDGKDLMSIINSAKSPQELTSLNEEMADIFSVFRQCGIIHGDCKATNFIKHLGKIYIIDLDAMQEMPPNSPFLKKHQKDLLRWQKNFPSNP